MQAIAREMNFSEPTFVLPAERPDTGVRMRIFTPAAEMPMAGHPTVGSTFALAHEGVIAPTRGTFVFGLGVGPVEVGLEWAPDDRLAFAWMTQLRPTFGEALPDTAGMAAALGLEAADLAVGPLPAQEVSCGVPFLMVPVATRHAVDNISVDLRALRALLSREGLAPAPPVFVFSLEPGADGATAYSRMFAPGLGVHEDPATGAASGPLGSYLVRHRAVAGADAGRIVNAQGVTKIQYSPYCVVSVFCVRLLFNSPTVMPFSLGDSAPNHYRSAVAYFDGLRHLLARNSGRLLCIGGIRRWIACGWNAWRLITAHFSVNEKEVR